MRWQIILGPKHTWEASLKTEMEPVWIYYCSLNASLVIWGRHSVVLICTQGALHTFRILTFVISPCVNGLGRFYHPQIFALGQLLGHRAKADAGRPPSLQGTWGGGGVTAPASAFHARWCARQTLDTPYLWFPPKNTRWLTNGRLSSHEAKWDTWAAFACFSSGSVLQRFGGQVQVNLGQ